MIHKTNRVHLVEQVAIQMEDLIVSGIWRVDEKIPPEIELMREFDVSRNTLREAIRALVHAGLLESKQGSGTIVRSANALSATLKRYIKKSALLDTLDVRLALEQQAAQLAATYRNETDLATLEQCIEACRQAVRKKDRKKFIEMDTRFHQTIVQASDNQLLIDLYEPLLENISESIEALINLNTPLKYEEELHLDLFAAIQNKDKKAASVYVEEYIGALKKDVSEMMEE
ncbi:FadR/GntR family transcriptional regulator [Salinicoccus siamensis]|uniref:FadR/GntR family transcriptional regulator n=1 Tax=Salinicoccus siamensis TaxID=381830 RepID=A0ABV5Z2V6_9STAP